MRTCHLWLLLHPIFFLGQVQLGSRYNFNLSKVTAGSGKSSDHVATGRVAFSRLAGSSIGVFRSLEWIGQAS